MWALPRRLEIELTSRRDDGTWTWRAAGARQPKGEVSGDLVPDAAAVGSVLKAEVDGGLDGLEITALFPPRSRPEPTGRLELIGGGAGPPVTTTLASRSGRRSRADRDFQHDDERSSGNRRRGRDQGDKRRGRDQRDRADRGPRRRDRGDDDRQDGSGRKPRRTDRDGRHPRGERDAGSHGDSERDGRPKRRGSDQRSQSGPRPKDGKRSARTPRPRTPGLKAKRVHRQAALAGLPEEQRPLAREVLKGGVPGARRSIERMNAKAAEESLPQIKSEPVLALAEQLAPVLKAAEWHDRADAALAGISKIDLRDIRSVIAAADRAARDDETRALAESLRGGLAQRLEVDHRKWLDELAGTIGEGRTVRALRISSRPVKPGSPLPPDMAERLAALAAANLNPTANQQRWATVVDSVALSPVRTQVIPAGIPERPSGDLLATIRRLADRVPQIAALFGVEPEPAGQPRLRPPPPPPMSTATEDAATEEAAATKEAAAEDAATKEAATEDAATEQAATEQAATEQAATEQAATEQAATEQAATEQAATEQAATEDGQ